MKVIEKVIEPPQPAREVEKVTKYICDTCGRESKDNDWSKEGSCFHSIEVEVSLVKRQDYPSGGYSEGWFFDICDICFFNKVKPYLEGLGAECRKEERDW